MTMKIENLDKAQVFWGLAKEGTLVLRALYMERIVALANSEQGERPVRVYILVEDD